MASGAVRVTRLANPARRSAGRWCPGPGRGRESWPRSRSSKARARSSSVPPSSPAAFSSRARAVIRSSAASTWSGDSSRPASAALPESSAHRSTRANLAAVSRRFLRLLGGGLHHGAGDRGAQPPGVSRPARSSTSASAARASASSSRPVAVAMSRALPRLTTPSRSAARVPGRWVSRCPAVPVSSSARNRDSPSAFAIWSAVNSASSGLRVPPGKLGDRRRACGPRRGPRPGPRRT